MTEREIKLEAAFLQFIALVQKMRCGQIDFDEHFGSQRRLNKRRLQERVDAALLNMGIDKDTNFSELKINFNGTDTEN